MTVVVWWWLVGGAVVLGVFDGRWMGDGGHEEQCNTEVEIKIIISYISW